MYRVTGLDYLDDILTVTVDECDLTCVAERDRKQVVQIPGGR